MVLFNVGRVCMKKAGRESGKQCVVVDVVDKNFVLVTGPLDVTGVKRRRVNVDHLEPTNVVLDVRKGASDDAVKKALAKVDMAEKEAVKPPEPAVEKEAAAEAKPATPVKRKRRAKKTTAEVKVEEKLEDDESD